jgi:hypothetical protein
MGTDSWRTWHPGTSLTFNDNGGRMTTIYVFFIDIDVYVSVAVTLLAIALYNFRR